MKAIKAAIEIILCYTLFLNSNSFTIFVVSPNQFGKEFHSHITYCIIFIQCQSNVFDVGPTLYKWYTNVFCLLCSSRARRVHMQ